MKLKKFAALVLMFTAASGLAMKPASMVTAVASEVVSEGPAIEADNTPYYTDVNTTAADTDTTVNTNTDVAEGENTDTINNTSSNTDTSDSNSKNKTVKNKKKSKPKAKANRKANKKTNKKTSKKSRSNYSKADLRLMSSIINCEAGIEPYQGKLAVGIVVMNRIKSKDFPNTLRGVIYQSGQFSPVRNGSLNRRLSEYDSGRIKSKQWKTCIKAAKKVLSGQRTILYRGKEKKMNNFYFFSVGLRGARLRLGGHKFK
ncbi:MAG: cell wall hydrolase [Lachnospiraceae bacterium]|nr:cell wall hydrolase [Lachnospiraceae bacterium]